MTQALQRITNSHASSEAAIRREKQERLRVEDGYVTTFRTLTDEVGEFTKARKEFDARMSGVDGKINHLKQDFVHLEARHWSTK